MTDVKHYQDAIARIFDTKWERGELSINFHFDTVDEAKHTLKVIRQKQKELRLIKKDVNADMKGIRANYQAQIDRVGSGAGLSGFLIGKGRAASMKAADKRGIRARRDRELEPYDQAKRVIDNLLTQLDGVKLQVDAFIRQNSA